MYKINSKLLFHTLCWNYDKVLSYLSWKNCGIGLFSKMLGSDMTIILYTYVTFFNIKKIKQKKYSWHAFKNPTL